MDSSADALAVRLCSQNRNKLRELLALLPEWELEPLDATEVPPETGESYYENALTKARFGQERAGGWVLGEDSGIEVDALGGKPGPRSARYAGTSATINSTASSARSSSRCSSASRSVTIASSGFTPRSLSSSAIVGGTQEPGRKLGARTQCGGGPLRRLL